MPAGQWHMLGAPKLDISVVTEWLSVIFVQLVLSGYAG